MKYYAGIGSRSTPPYICLLMKEIAHALEKRGYILRSGGAEGADASFEAGVGSTAKEIYLPWPGFNGNKSFLNYTSKEAMAMAAKYHPAWDQCSQGAKKLHARNCHQILGMDLATPSDFVICWTPGGQLKGGTAQALRIALDLDIRIYNLALDADRLRLATFLRSI